MKTIFFILLVQFSILGVLQSQISDSIKFGEKNSARKYIIGNLFDYNPTKAFQIYMKYAIAGDAEAMNAIGKMYIEGLGIKQNADSAFIWFNNAVQLGYVKSWLNLGLMYKYGQGTALNFNRAYECFRNAAETGNVKGLYYQGYMLYKGLGCKQDYFAAFELFKTGSLKQYAPSMYFLGLCYRNGYGTIRDSISAILWLSKSAKIGYKYAEEELMSPYPENTDTIHNMKTYKVNNQIVIPSVFKRVKHNLTYTNLSGIYSGFLIKYDYSGNCLLRKIPVKIELVKVNNRLKCIWMESAASITELEVVLTDSSLLFTHGNVLRTNHYNPKNPVNWEFKSATMEVIIQDTNIYLMGNIHLFDINTLEPNKPMYLSLVRDNLNKDEKTELKSNLISNFRIFPNPFNGNITITFNLNEEMDVKVVFINTNGNEVYSHIYKKLKKGENNLNYFLEIPKGIYVVKLETKVGGITNVVLNQ